MKKNLPFSRILAGLLVAAVISLSANTAQAVQPSALKVGVYNATAGYNTVRFTPGSGVQVTSIVGTGCSGWTCRLNGRATLIKLLYYGCGPVTVTATARPGSGKRSFTKTWALC